MTIEQYYRWINTKAGKKIKDFMNRLIPGLMLDFKRRYVL